MINYKIKNYFLLIFMLLLLSGCTTIMATEVHGMTRVEIEPVPNINTLPIMNNKSVYDNDDPASIVYLYATIMKGAPSDYADNTWYDVNQTVNKFGVINPTVRCKVLLQEGDENGPVPGMFGYEQELPNGVISVRGQSSTSYRYQKSYRVGLFDESEPWRDTRNIALNKHVYDSVRVRNKLSYDLMQQLPGIVSSRTQFVHLFVKDETVYPKETTFSDYGLYTQVQTVNRAFLRNHGLDTEGHVYKVTLFNFYQNEELKLESDPNFDSERFELILSPGGRTNDHEKLLNMIADVNDYSLDIDYVLEKHIDLDSYTTWIAFNMLTGNYDSINQNYILYSPLNSMKWYFIPWDHDGGFLREDEIEGRLSPRGISVYWEVVLHERALKSEVFREALQEKMDIISSIITPELIQQQMDIYYPVVSPFINRMPDKQYYDLNRHKLNFDYEWENLPYSTLIYKDFFIDSFNKPQPFFMTPPEIIDDKLLFEWNSSYHFNNERLYYDFALSTDIHFNNIINEQNGLVTTMALVDMLAPGTYYFKVEVYDIQGHRTKAYGRITGENRARYFGVRSFTITDEGEIDID